MQPTRHAAGRAVTVAAALLAAGCGDTPTPAEAPLALDTPRPSAPSTASALGAKEVVSHVVRPEKRVHSEELVATLTVADGFAIATWAKDLGHARMLAVAGDGTVYLTRPVQGDVLALRDRDGDGKAEERTTAIADLKQVHGIALENGSAWLAGPTTLWRAKVKPDGTFAQPEILADDLPDGGQHPNRTLAFGPDGRLYVSVGSSCNACEETNPEHATMLVMDANVKNREVFASGLRNTIGFGWHPVTGELWGMDHGSDARGDDVPPEELNQIVEGKDYGWPWAYGKREVDPITGDPEQGTKEERARKSEPSTLEYRAHSAPIGMVFGGGTLLPESMRDDAFVAMRGSWNRLPPSGYEVVRIAFDGGRPTGFHPVVQGWLIEGGAAHFGRLAGVALAKDGAILVSDDANGVIYRIAPVSSAR